MTLGVAFIRRLPERKDREELVFAFVPVCRIMPPVGGDFCRMMPPPDLQEHTATSERA
jgi:hypothetical protein